MSNPTRRFNLRSRKSLKNQLECCECKRNYFPLELSEDDENDEQTANICCDCNGKRQTEPEPKRRAIAIKKEQIISNFDDQCQSNGPTIYKTTHNLNPGNMVQIHSIELIKPITVTPAPVIGTKSKLCVLCISYSVDKMMINYCVSSKRFRIDQSRRKKIGLRAERGYENQPNQQSNEKQEKHHGNNK